MNKPSRIKQRREELDLTQEDLAKMIGVSRGTIAKYESGMIENMRKDKLAALARILGVSVPWLLDMDNNQDGGPSDKYYLEEVRKRTEAMPSLRVLWNLIKNLPDDDVQMLIAMAQKLNQLKKEDEDTIWKKGR